MGNQPADYFPGSIFTLQAGNFYLVQAKGCYVW